MSVGCRERPDLTGRTTYVLGAGGPPGPQTRPETAAVPDGPAPIATTVIASGLGLRLERARSMNDDPVFIAALADVAEAALARSVPA